MSVAMVRHFNFRLWVYQINIHNSKIVSRLATSQLAMQLATSYATYSLLMPFAFYVLCCIPIPLSLPGDQAIMAEAGVRLMGFR